LVKTKVRENDLEQFKHTLLIRAALLDRTNPEEVAAFNNMLSDYWDLLIPEKKRNVAKSVEDKNKMFEDFKKNFQIIIKKDKLKNFQKA